MKRTRRIALPLLAAGAASLGGGIAASAGERGPQRTSGPVAPAAASKPYTAKISYHETNPGSSQGPAIIGIQGKGTFSVRLSARAALAAAVIEVATGVPVTKIAGGGTYSLQRDIAGDGTITGTIVARFKAHGLGTLCLSYREKPGTFMPGMPFVPMSGSIRTVGGTGQAATWRAAITFKQTSVTGPSTLEQFAANGSEHVSTGKAKPMTATCKRVARL